ncbi:MAG: hypothetical protein WD342_00715 [Verrucomicrobiales bacterium]
MDLYRRTLECLKFATRLDGSPLLSSEEALTRTTLVTRAVCDAGFKLEPRVVPFPLPKEIEGRYPAYRIADPRFDLDKPQAPVFAVEGPGLSDGDLVKLSECCVLADRHLGKDWWSRNKKALRNPQGHLDLLEEIWWLGRFHGVAGVVPNVKLDSARAKDVDWMLRAGELGPGLPGQPLNLEVKFKRRDWVARVDGTDFVRDGFNWYFEGFEGKFSRHGDGSALNLACISTFAPLDRELAVAAEEFLAKNDAVDGVLVWSHHCLPGQEHLGICARKDSDYLRTLMTPPSPEHEERVVPLRYVLRNGKERRPLTPEETIQMLSNFHQDHPS